MNEQRNFFRDFIIGVLAGAAAIVILTPLLGWMGDSPTRDVSAPARVHGIVRYMFSRTGRWASVLFWTVGMIAIFGLGARMMLTSFVVAGVFGGILLARRLAAQKDLPITVSQIVQNFSGRGYLAMAAFGAIVLAESRTGHPVLYTPALLAVIGAIAVIVRAARRHVTRVVTANQVHAIWGERVGAIFGATPAVVETAAMAADGHYLYIQRVPASFALALDNRAALDKRVASVAPQHEIAPESDHQQIVIQPASQDTIDRRKNLASSGGLITGIDASTGKAAPKDPFAIEIPEVWAAVTAEARAEISASDGDEINDSDFGIVEEDI